MVIPSPTWELRQLSHTTQRLPKFLWTVLPVGCQLARSDNLVESSTSPVFNSYHPVVQNHPVGFVPFVWPVYLWPADSPSPKPKKHSLTRAKIQTLTAENSLRDRRLKNHSVSNSSSTYYIRWNL
jgi:hypothetical protein